jgi:hypothetical protein
MLLAHHAIVEEEAVGSRLIALSLNVLNLQIMMTVQTVWPLAAHRHSQRSENNKMTRNTMRATQGHARSQEQNDTSHCTCIECT